MGGGLKTPSGAVSAPPQYSPDVPTKITTPDTTETRIGTLSFKDGAPDPEMVKLLYDQLDFGRRIDVLSQGYIGYHHGLHHGLHGQHLDAGSPT